MSWCPVRDKLQQKCGGTCNYSGTVEGLNKENLLAMASLVAMERETATHLFTPFFVLLQLRTKEAMHCKWKPQSKTESQKIDIRFFDNFCSHMFTAFGQTTVATIGQWHPALIQDRRGNGLHLFPKNVKGTETKVITSSKARSP